MPGKGYEICQLWIGICQEHLPVTEQQLHGHLPPACAATTADLQHLLKGIQGREWGNLWFRETAETGL